MLNEWIRADAQEETDINGLQCHTADCTAMELTKCDPCGEWTCFLHRGMCEESEQLSREKDPRIKDEDPPLSGLI